MRCSLILLAAALACSSSTAPHGLVLTTEISSTAAKIGDTLVVGLHAVNASDTTVRIPYYAPMGAAFTPAPASSDGFGAGSLSPATLTMTAGDATTVGQITVEFLPTTPGGSPNINPNNERITLAPGSYHIRACVAVPAGTGILGTLCGNSLPFTLTQ